MSHLDDGVLQALLDGEISSSELAPIQAHLDQCAECQEKLAEARQFMVEADRLVELIEVPARAAPDGRTGASPAQRMPRRRLRWAGPVALAAVVVLALGIGSLTMDRLRNGAPESLATPVFPGSVTSEAQKAVLEDSQPAAPAAANAAPPTALERRAQPMRSRPDLQGRISAANKPAEAGRPVADAAEPALAKEAKPAPRPVPAPAPPLRLDELVTAGSERAAAKDERERRVDSAAREFAKIQAAEPADLRRAENDRLLRPLVSRDKEAAALVTADEALRTLGGSIKLIDGLMPKTFELVADRIRVSYPMSWGPLVLEEWREAGDLRYRLIPPAGMPADSLAVLAARIR